MRMMKFFHLLGLSVALSLLSLNTTLNALDLQTYLKTTQYLYVAYQGGGAVYRDVGVIGEETIQYEQVSTLQVAKALRSNDLCVDTDPQHHGIIDPDTLQATHFLPQIPNHATFMQLSYNQFGNWFFTAPLSGCEIWIAHDRNPESQPLIIYINTHDCGNERKLGERERLGSDALERYNNENDRRYELLQRIMPRNPEVYPNPDDYLHGLHERFPHAHLSIYDGHAIFYGMHRQPYVCEDDTTAYYGGWNFYLRDSEQLLFYNMRGTRGSLASTLCSWLRYLSRGYTDGRMKRKALSTMCSYVSTILRGYAENGRLSLSDTKGTLTGSVPTEQNLYLSGFFPEDYKIGAPFNQIPIRTIQYDCNTTELHINTRALETLTILPGILELHTVSISVNATLSPVGVQYLVFTGSWGIGTLKGHVSVEDSLETNQLLIRGGPQGTDSLNFEDLIENLTGKRISIPVGSVSFRDVEIVGAIDTFTGGSITLSFGGKYGQNNIVQMILQKGISSLGAKYVGGVATEFTRFRFADLIQHLTAVDISGIPFLVSLVVPTMAVTISTASISSSNLLEGFKAGSLLQLTNGYIQEGVTAYFRLSSMKDAPLKMSYSTSKFSFEVLMKHSVDLNAFLPQVGLTLDSVKLPPGISNILYLNIMQFSINTSAKEILLDVNFPNTLSYFSGLLKLQNIKVSVHALLNAPRNISVEASGHIEIANQMFDVYIKHDDTNKYTLSIQISKLKISDIIRKFGASILPDKLNEVIKSSGFLDFSIKNVGVSFTFGSPPLQIQISGSPVLNGYEAPYIFIIIIKHEGKIKLIQGLEFGVANLADLIQSVTGINLHSTTIFNQQLQATILISPVTLPGFKLQGKHLNGFSINQGISLQATMTWPSDCSSVPSCNVAQALLGKNARLMLQGTIANTQSFRFTAGVSDIRLCSLFTLEKAGFEVRVFGFGDEIQIGIFGSLHISNPDITLNGAIRVGTRGVVLELSMAGCWEQAFGVDWLTICSLQGVVALKPELNFLPGGLALGGEVKIGKPSCGSQIQASGFVGVDADTPKQNYYYVNIRDKLTFGSMLERFCIDMNLPRPLSESGFPEGFFSSFSLMGKELPRVPVSIPSGFQVKGTFNILGLTTTVDINIGLPRGLKAVVLLPPLELSNGLLTMYASKSDSSRGPYLNVSIALIPPNVNMEASGYLSVLGISTEVILRITNSEYRFSISGKLLNLFESDLEITAAYGDIHSASFRVRGSFGSDLFNRIADLVDNALKESIQEATTAITAAQLKLDSARGHFNDANCELSNAQHHVDAANADFDTAVRTLRSAQVDVRGFCTPPNCRDVCVPAPCGSTCAATAWGKCILAVPTFSSCCFKAPDLVCEAARAGCFALRETGLFALRTAEEIVDSSRLVLDIANGVLEGAKGVVSAANHTLDIAIFALEAIKQTYKVGAEAANAVAQFTLKDLFSIKEMIFDVALGVANGGSYDVDVKGRILGKDVDVSVNINIQDINSVAKQLAEEVIDGLSSFFG